MGLFYVFLTLFSVLGLLFNNLKIHGAEISDPNSNPKKVEYAKSLYIDNFNLLKTLALSDLKIVKHLIHGVEKLREKNQPIPEKVEEYIEDLKRGNEEIFNSNWTKKTAETIAKNPISAYRLFHRYTRDLPLLTYSALFDPVFDKVKDAIDPELFEWAELEGEIDLDIATNGILALQNVYGISAEKVSQGKFPLVDLHGQLDAKHCYEIGLKAGAQKLSAQAVEWLELAVEKSKVEGFDLASQEGIQDKLESAITEHDELYKNDKSESPYPNLFDHLLKPQTESDTESGGTKLRRTRRQTDFEIFRGSRKLEHLPLTRFGICAGENYQTEEEKRHLFCWYEFKAHPKLRIGPFKMEFLSQDPDIVMIYDFIGDLAIKKIFKAMKHKGTRRRYADDDPRAWGDQTGSQGIGKFNWIWDGEQTPASIHPTFDLLSVAKNVEGVLGVSVRKIGESELLYARSYTWASRTKLHVDFQYITSVIHYLTDVDLGGFTAFPAAGLAVKPVKGAAAIWFNQLRDKTHNNLAKHQSCPVLFGRKIVATKWIMDDANIFKFNCALKKGQQFHVQVNGKDCKRQRTKQTPFEILSVFKL